MIVIPFSRSGIFYQYSWLISRILWLLDGLLVIGLMFILCWFYQVPFRRDYVILSAITLFLTALVFPNVNLYRPWRGVELMRLVRRVFLAWIVLVSLLFMLGYITKTSANYSRRIFLSWMVLAPVALILLRLQVYVVLRWFRSQGRNTRTAIIGGAGELGKRVAKNVCENPWLGMKLFGFFDDNLLGSEIALPPRNQTFPVLGNLEEMAAFVQANRVDMVYLALPLRAEERLREIIEALQDTTASVYFVPDVFTFSLLRAGVTDLRGLPLISLWDTPFHGVNSWLKRAEDIILASLILLLVSPVMLAVALAVKFSSPGPVLFRQRRYGLDGQEIVVLKFRTMRVCEDGPQIPQATAADPRVTLVGRFLRRTSLDELPQFLNVLQGSMSIVGPRPHAVAHNEYYRRLIRGYMLRHKVRPGITGLAQINGFRGETQKLEKMEKRVEFDLEYLRHWSLWLDLKIIALTPLRVFSDKHAY
jgi:putative colanic acid biosynthesis UDP-glucose lipid carrier transferase